MEGSKKNSRKLTVENKCKLSISKNEGGFYHLKLLILRTTEVIKYKL